MKRINLFLLLLISAICISCGPTFHLSDGQKFYVTEVDSYGEYNLSGKTYFIESGDENIKTSDLEFLEYAKLLEASLKMQGAIRTTNKESADLCILVNYAITDQSYNETVPIPIWGQTGVSSITTNSSTTGSVYGSAYAIGSSAYGSAYGQKNTTTTTEVKPTYGITGVTNVNRHVTSYNRVFNAYAYDNKSESHEMVWKTNLSSKGSSSKLREVLPYMIYAAYGTFGTNTSEKYKVGEKDYMFQSWKQAILSKNNVTLFPRVESTNCKSDCDIALIERTQTETIIVLHFKQNTYYKISPYICISANGTEYQVLSADDYTLGSYILNKGNGTLRLHFAAIPKDINRIELIDYSNKNKTRYAWYWKGIQI